MAFMTAFVSASSLRYFNATGGPTRTVTVGGLARFNTLGNLALRGHTCSVPHSPTGMIGALPIAAKRAAPQRPFSLGSKKARPRGMVPWGMIATISPP